jgi:hypothetical protein
MMSFIYIQEGHALMGIAEVRTIYEGAQEWANSIVKVFLRVSQKLN